MYQYANTTIAIHAAGEPNVIILCTWKPKLVEVLAYDIYANKVQDLKAIYWPTVYLTADDVQCKHCHNFVCVTVTYPSSQ